MTFDFKNQTKTITKNPNILSSDISTSNYKFLMLSQNALEKNWGPLYHILTIKHEN